MKTVGAYEAKTHLPQLLETVAQGETITITKQGKPVAILVPASGAQDMTADAAVEAIRALRSEIRPLDRATVRELIEEGRR